MAALKNLAAGAKVQTLFNTHYHLDQTGNNEMFAAAGAKIIAHERTRAVDVDRLLGSRPKTATRKRVPKPPAPPRRF